MLRSHKADAVLWGEVPKQGDSLRFFLRGGGKQETQTLVFDKGLAKDRPDSAFGTVLAAVTLSQIVTVTERDGHHLASQLKPVSARLKALLAEPRLLPATELGNLHNAHGMALEVIGEQAGDNSALHDAITAYHNALEGRTRESAPLDWARTQNNLGNALSKLGHREKSTARLEKAVKAYHNALQAGTRKSASLQWATTQSNLGVALLRLGELESNTKLVNDAVSVFRDALLERTRKRVPLDWAYSQHGLANTLPVLAEQVKSGVLMKEAIACMRGAASEYQRGANGYWLPIAQSRISEMEARLGRLQQIERRVSEIDAILTKTRR